MRKYLGSAILILTIVTVLISSYITSSIIGKTYTVEFVRGDRMEDDSATTIAEITDILKSNPKVKAKITGYTSNDGDDQANLELSSHRADAIKAQIVANGIDDSRISTIGLGSKNQLDKLHDETDVEWQHRNSRAEIKLVKRDTL